MTLEAQRLAKLFEERVPNRAQWARDHRFPGGQAMIYQHIQGLKPISLEAATIYANFFKLPLATFNPAAAHIVARAKRVEETPASYVTHDDSLPNSTAALLRELHDKAAKLSDRCIAQLIERAEMLAETHADQANTGS